MDEPLSNLDAKLRVQTRSEIKHLQEQVGTTTIYVTHDQVEAMTMGDRVAVMSEGVLEQVGDTRTVYDARERVRGRVHREPGDELRDTARCERERRRADAVARATVAVCRCGASVPAERVPDEVIVGVRPEHARLWSDGYGLLGPIAGRAEFVEMLGRETLIGVVTAEDQRFTVLADADDAGEARRPGPLRARAGPPLPVRRRIGAHVGPRLDSGDRPEGDRSCRCPSTRRSTGDRGTAGRRSSRRRFVRDVRRTTSISTCTTRTRTAIPSRSTGRW